MSNSLMLAPAAPWVGVQHRPRPPAKRVSKLATWPFYFMMIFTITNVAALQTRFTGGEYALNPIVFFAAAVPIVLFSRSQKSIPSSFFLTAWIFFALFSSVGFLGRHRPPNMSDYNIAQIIIKLWIGLIGIPWLTGRVVTRDQFPTFVKIMYGTVALACPLALLQVVDPNLLKGWVNDEGRGAGLWINPNSCGMVCTAALVFTLIAPLRNKVWNLVLQGLFVATIVATLSRSSIASLAVIFLAYGCVTQRPATVLKTIVVMAVIAFGGTFALSFVGQGQKHVAERVARVTGILTGRGAKGSELGRWETWGPSFEACKEEWLLGRGHGSMFRVVQIGAGLGPHNDLLFIWGNSGIVALLAYLAFWANVVWISWRVRNRELRAVLAGFSLMFFFQCMFTHNVLAFQFVGVIIAVQVLAAGYGRMGYQPRTQSVSAAVRHSVAMAQ